MYFKSLIGGIAIAATVAGAQAPDAQSKASAKAAAKTHAAGGYKKDLPEKLMKKARVAESAAAATALAKVPGGTIESVEIEEEDGKLVYSYDIKVAGKSGIEEIQVDAISGAVVKTEHEDPAAMKKEADEDAKMAMRKKDAEHNKPAAKKPAAPVVKKP